jgi:hypothetical protein
MEEMDCRHRRRYANNGSKTVEKQCEEREEWKRITEKAKTHSGL